MGKKAAAIFGLLAAAAILTWIAWPTFSHRSAAQAGGREEVNREDAGSRPASDGAMISPRRIDEEPGAAETAATDTRPVVEIEVVDAEGAPAAGAKLVAWRGAEIIGGGNKTCGADGIARLAAADGTGDVAVSFDGHPIHHEQLSLAAGRRRIALTRGAAISGSVEVDGRRPDEPVTLRLRQVEVGDWIDRAPADAHYIFTSGNGRTEQVEAATKPDGTFRFSGLPEGWAGGLYPGGFNRYAFEGMPRRSEDGEAHLVVSAPTEGLLVRLHRWPVVKGRVVTSDTRAPVPNAPIYCGFWSDSGDSSGSYLWTDEQGRFQATIAVWNPVRIAVDAEDPQRLVRKHVERTGAFERDVDLGDIELAALRDIAFVVRDAGGAPIPGAVAATGLRQDVLSEKTDADGAGKIRMDPEAGTLRVGGVGYEVVDVPLPRDLMPPLVVTLPRGTRLDLVVTTPSGGPPPGIEIEIRLKQVWFDQTTRWPDPLLVAAGASEPKGGSSRSNAGFVASFRPDAKGRVALAGIRAGVPFEIEARDELRSFKQVSTVTLGPGESRELAIVIEKPPRALRGIVRDRAGSPLPGAGVEIWVPLPEDPRRQPAQLGTDPAGRFGLPAVYADRVDLMIRKAGFVAVVGKGIEPRGDAEPSVFVLVPSRHVTAMVVDAAGQRMRALGMMATVVGGLELAGDRNQSGDFDFADLPEGTVAFRAAVGGRLYTQDHDTRQPVAKIVVPVHGSLKVKWEFRLESGNVNDLRVESLEPGGPTLTEFIQNSESKTRGDVTVRMLPGRYAVWLETTPFDSMEVQKIESHSASKRREITLIAGETESVTLDP